MRQVITLGLLIAGGLVMWRLGERLSPDALGMAVGLIFGVLAMVPAVLLALGAGQQGRAAEFDDPEGWPDEYIEPAAQLTVNETHYHYHAAPAALPKDEQSIVVVQRPKQLTGGRYE